MVRDTLVKFPTRKADALGPDATRTEGRNAENDKQSIILDTSLIVAFQKLSLKVISV